MSAGELEHEWAGTPGRLIRERYRKAGDMSKVGGSRGGEGHGNINTYNYGMPCKPYIT